MGCACSNSRCHCHCRKHRKLPERVTEENVNDLISADEFTSWLNSDAYGNQFDWVKLSKWLDAFWWTQLAIAVVNFLIAHIVGIFIDPWATCYDYMSGNGRSLSDGHFSWACSVSWHLFVVPVTVFWIIVSFYGLRYWSHEQAEVIYNMIAWSNIVNIGHAVAELLAAISVTQNEAAVEKSPLYQVILIWILSISLLGITGLGFYVQYRINMFLHTKKQGREVVYPSNESDLISLVRQAYNNHSTIRCIGSEHSQRAAIWPADDNVTSVTISLDNYRDIVEWDEENMRVTVEAGIILGENENKPWSKYKNGLVKQLDKKGWALPDLGGVVKQSAGGFTMMGCAGGSLRKGHDYFDAIYSLRIIDGTGTPQVFTRPDEKSPDYEDDPFWGVVTSMGLYGVVSQITYQCEPRYNVIGSQVTLSVRDFAKKGDNSQADGVGKVSFDGTKSDQQDVQSVYEMFTKEENVNYKLEYARYYWYPQTSKTTKDEWIVLWKGHRQVFGPDENKENDEELSNPFAPGPDSEQKQYRELFSKTGRFKPKPYYEIAESPIASHLASHVVHFLFNIFGADVDAHTHKVSAFVCDLISTIIQVFVKPDKNDPTNVANQVYGDTWWRILPMDQAISDKLMPFQFTELWVDIKDTDKAIKVIRDYFDRDEHLNHMGTFGWEFYVCTGDNIWMRPGYKRDCFRIDILWFDIESRIPYSFYNNFWEFLIENGIDFRPHWGKWCPAGEQEFPQNKQGIMKWSDYYRSQIPRWDDFLALRKKMDPHNVFLTEYWARMLDIQDELFLRVDSTSVGTDVVEDLQDAMKKKA